MLSPSDLRNPQRKSGYNNVNSASPGPNAGGGYVIRWRAEGPRGSAASVRGRWRGPTRARALEAAQDYCDWYNGVPVKPATKLKSAGHKANPRPKMDDPEVQAALGVLRDARAQRRGVQGYVYLIIEDRPGGGLRYGKIGFSTNPRKRVAELQTGNPRPLKLLYAMPGTEADEQRLHQKYIRNNVLQEWFMITKDLILEFPAHTSATSSV